LEILGNVGLAYLQLSAQILLPLYLTPTSYGDSSQDG